MAIGFAVKHNRLPLKRLLFCGGDTVFSEEGVGVASGDEIDDLLQRGMEVAPFFLLQSVNGSSAVLDISGTDVLTNQSVIQ